MLNCLLGNVSIPLETMKYYWLNVYEDDQTPVAFAPEGVPLGHELIKDLHSVDEFPYPFKLHKVEVNDHIIKGKATNYTVDYLPNSFAFPLMSERMKSIIEDHLFGTENMRWIHALVVGESKSFNYYIPMFCQKMDTLNREKTILAPSSGIVLNPCFDTEKIKKYAIFHGESLFWQISLKIYVNEAIKKSLKYAHITAVQFSPVRVL